MAFKAAAWAALVVSILLSGLGMFVVRSRVDRLWLTVAAYVAKRRNRNAAVTTFDVRTLASVVAAAAAASRGHSRACETTLSRGDCGWFVWETRRVRRCVCLYLWLAAAQRAIIVVGCLVVATMLVSPTITTIAIVVTLDSSSSAAPALMALISALMTVFAMLTWHARSWVYGLRPVAPTAFGRLLHRWLASVRLTLMFAVALFFVYLLWAALLFVSMLATPRAHAGVLVADVPLPLCACVLVYLPALCVRACLRCCVWPHRVPAVCQPCRSWL